MDIVFYSYLGEKNRINKDLTNLETITITNCNFNSEYNIINPTIKISSDSDMTKYNYCLIDSKYYFIKNFELNRNGFYIIKLNLDVLMTYKDIILAQYGTVTQSKTALYLYNTSIPVDGNTQKVSYNFENPFNANGNYVMISSGRGTSNE